MICVKTHRVLIAMLEGSYHKTLVELIIWFLARYSDTCITSAFRDGDPGVHGTVPCRGMDVRSRNFENPQAVVDDINSHWVYDPGRPEKMCAIYHDVGLGPHIHLQVHNNTNLRKKS